MQFHQHRFFFKAISVCMPRARPRQQLLVCSRGHCSSVDGVHATRHVQQNADEPALQQMSLQCWRLCLSICLTGVVLSQWTKKKKLLTFIPFLVATDFQPREQQHQMLPYRGLASHVIHDFPPANQGAIIGSSAEEGRLLAHHQLPTPNVGIDCVLAARGSAPRETPHAPSDN
jgi:hypothetical protein